MTSFSVVDERKMRLTGQASFEQKVEIDPGVRDTTFMSHIYTHHSIFQSPFNHSRTSAMLDNVKVTLCFFYPSSPSSCLLDVPIRVTLLAYHQLH